MAFLLKKAVSSKVKKFKRSLENSLFETRIYTCIYTVVFYFFGSFFCNKNVN